MESYIFKRKIFNIIETLSESGQKVERKGKYFFLKHFKDRNELDRYRRINKVFITSGVQVPKLRYVDKKGLCLLFDFIDAEPVLNSLQYGDLKEEIYDELCKMFWRCKQEKVNLDFNPINFKFDGERLYYLSSYYTKLEKPEDFLNKDLRMWFYTKESVALLKENNLKQEGTLEEEYATNKRITLMCVKYYR